MDNYIDAVLVHEMFHAFNACSGEMYYFKELVYESLASYVEKTFMYDVKDDMEQIESYRDLATIHGLFNQVQLDPSRTCVYWNDEIDLPSDTLYEYGKLIAS